MRRPEHLWLVVDPVDMRRGIDGLSAHVQHRLGRSPCSGGGFIFRNKAGTRLKLLVWDGNGVWLCQRRLHRGGFAWPAPGEAVFALTPAQWEWSVAGVDWRRLSATPPTDWQDLVARAVEGYKAHL
nr:IS66 family insertion sequence element accessory protein TnpB [Methylomagnum ishizawai]